MVVVTLLYFFFIIIVLIKCSVITILATLFKTIFSFPYISPSYLRFKHWLFIIYWLNQLFNWGVFLEIKHSNIPPLGGDNWRHLFGIAWWVKITVMIIYTRIWTIKFSILFFFFNFLIICYIHNWFYDPIHVCTHIFKMYVLYMLCKYVCTL